VFPQRELLLLPAKDITRLCYPYCSSVFCLTHLM